METPVFLWDEKILQCADCKTQEGGIAARMRRYRHPKDRGRYYADCAECGGANLPIPDSPKCYDCDGAGFVEYPEFEINACERCGGSGVLPNVAISQPEDGKHTL